MTPALPVVSQVLRTPESRFTDLPDFAYAPQYAQVGGLRIAYIDEGPRDAPVVLLMHGEPTWSFLYRKMIPPLLQAGLRVVAPDLVGFGRSDKPARRQDHSYGNQVAWMHAWLQAVDLQGITLCCQDWGSLIGLRMVVDAPQRFTRIVLANGGLPTGTTPTPRAFHIWRAGAPGSRSGASSHLVARSHCLRASGPPTMHRSRPGATASRRGSCQASCPPHPKTHNPVRICRPGSFLRIAKSHF